MNIFVPEMKNNYSILFGSAVNNIVLRTLLI